MGFVVGLDWKFCVYLEKLENEFVLNFSFCFCFCLWFERLDNDFERDFVMENFCFLCVKLEDWKNGFVEDGVGLVDIEEGCEVFWFVFELWGVENVDDLNKDLMNKVGLFVWDGVGVFRLFFWDVDFMLGLGSVDGFDELLFECRFLVVFDLGDEKVRDFDRCLDLVMGEGGGGWFEGGVVCRENKVFGVGGCWGM